MPLSWNEIRHNAVAFAREWSEESREQAEAQSFYNFPWPAAKQQAAVEAKAQKMRESFADPSFAELYDPLSMQAKLANAHAELDRAVELAYRKKPFRSDRERVEFLFQLHERLTSPLTTGLKEPATKQPQRRHSADEDANEGGA